nr:flagellar assembly peptidoglycan hydrolase FlgJ [sulfur-oxidizing endosymbiont of Gigantopelta aegis]
MESKTDIYTDLNGLQNLKVSARKDAKSALPEVARQFEAVMISMMIKNLRKTGMEDPIFKSQAMDSYRDMYDQQLGMELSKGQGIGFAKTIVEQMQYQASQQSSQNGKKIALEQEASYTMPVRRHFIDPYAVKLAKSNPDILPQTPNVSQASEISAAIPTATSEVKFSSPEQFVEILWPLAEKAAQQLGVSTEVIISQAALETGWGKYIISDDKKSSFNLFNIKADQRWSGDKVEKVSDEFVRGKRVQQKSNFRAYGSYEQSFTDYVRFIKNNSRYSEYSNKNNNNLNETEQSLHDKAYVKGIHNAGYATDPNYANKVLRVLNSEPVQNQRLNQLKLASK